MAPEDQTVEHPEAPIVPLVRMDPEKIRRTTGMLMIKGADGTKDTNKWTRKFVLLKWELEVAEFQWYVRPLQPAGPTAACARTRCRTRLPCCPPISRRRRRWRRYHSITPNLHSSTSSCRITLHPRGDRPRDGQRRARRQARGVRGRS